MDALKNALPRLSIVFFFATSGCAATLPPTSSERAIAIYRDSLGQKGPNALPTSPENRSHDKPHPNVELSGPMTLTIDLAIEMAKKNSSRLLALQAAAAAAEANVAAADRVKNPELRVSQVRLNDVINNLPQVRTALRFFPDRPGAVAADIAEARAKHALALANARAEELGLESDVRWAFDDVALLDAEIAAAGAIAQTRQSIAKHLQSRVAGGESTSLEETLAQLSAIETDSDVERQKALRQQALGTLLDLVNINSTAKIEIQGEPPLAWPPPELPSEQTLVERALRRSPEVAVAAARMDATDARAYAERAKRFPWFSFLEVGYEFSTRTTPGYGWTFQGGMDIPIFDTNRHGIAASDAAKTAAVHAFEAEVDRVTNDVRARLRDVRATEELVTQYRERALPIAEKAEKQAQQALDARNIDTIRALNIEEKRELVQLRLVQLIRRYRMAISELRRTSGSVNSAATP